MDMDKKIEGRFERLDEKVDGNSRKIDENARKIEENGRKIEENGRKIEENSRKIEENGRKIDENGTRLDRVEAKLDTHDEYFVVLIKMMNDYSKKMDENQEEIRRLFGVKDEQHSSDLKGLGEGIQFNRERLDDHEGRLEDLEAS